MSGPPVMPMPPPGLKPMRVRHSTRPLNFRPHSKTFGVWNKYKERIEVLFAYLPQNKTAYEIFSARDINMRSQNVVHTTLHNVKKIELLFDEMEKMISEHDIVIADMWIDEQKTVTTWMEQWKKKIDKQSEFALHIHMELVLAQIRDSARRLPRKVHIRPLQKNNGVPRE